MADLTFRPGPWDQGATVAARTAAGQSGELGMLADTIGW